MSANPSRPGSVWYLIPAAVAVLAFMLVPAAVLRMISDKSALSFQLKAPGMKEFEISKPGKYVLWNETQTMFDGQTYSSSVSLPGGIHFELVELGSSTSIPMTSDTSTTFTVGSTVRHSVGAFEVTKSGKYRLSAMGQFPDRIFYFRASLWRQARPLINAIFLAMSGMMIALILAVIIFLVRGRAQRTTQ